MIQACCKNIVLQMIYEMSTSWSFELTQVLTMSSKWIFVPYRMLIDFNMFGFVVHDWFQGTM